MTIINCLLFHYQQSLFNRAISNNITHTNNINSDDLIISGLRVLGERAGLLELGYRSVCRVFHFEMLEEVHKECSQPKQDGSYRGYCDLPSSG